MAIAVYVRVSTIGQNVEGQRREIQRWLDGNGITDFDRGLKVSVFLEVEGAGHYLPKYAGNLDIMTSAALRTGERLAAHAARPVMA